jgi:hypothetical protein
MNQKHSLTRVLGEQKVLLTWRQRGGHVSCASSQLAAMYMLPHGKG